MVGWWLVVDSVVGSCYGGCYPGDLHPTAAGPDSLLEVGLVFVTVERQSPEAFTTQIFCN